MWGKKRTGLYGVLAMILVFSLVLAACSGNNVGSTTPGPSSGNNEKSSNTGKGPTEGKVTLRVLASINQLTKDLNTIQYLNDIANAAGVIVEWDQVKTGWDERKNPMLASGELPDIFIGSLNDSDITTYQSLFLPLEDLIAEHAPNISRMFDEVPASKAIATAIDGHIYGLPSVLPHRPGSSAVQMINKTWLDELGLAIPKTFDDLYNVLKAFKEKDPNGNNVADEIPFDWAPDMGLHSGMGLLGSYGNYALNFHGMNNIKDGKVVYVAETEDYKQLVSFLHTLYADGLINQEVVTQDWSQFDSRSKDPAIPLVGYTIGWSIDQRVGDVWADHYVVFEPMAVSEGVKPLWPSDTNGMKIQANKAQVTASSQHPEAAMRFLDQFYTEASSIQGYYGSFGEGTEDLGGTYKVLPPAEGFTEDTWKWTNALVDQGMLYVSDELEARFEAPGSIKERIEQDELLKPYFQPSADVFPSMKYTKDESDRLSIIQTDMDKLVQLKWAEWITKGGVEQEWDAYIAELYKMNLEEYKEIQQTAYNRSQP